MTAKTLKQIKQIDAAAERAGGYVMDPAKITRNPNGEKAFTEMRQYSREKGIPMSQLSDSAFSKKQANNPE